MDPFWIDSIYFSFFSISCFGFLTSDSSSHPSYTFITHTFSLLHIIQTDYGSTSPIFNAYHGSFSGVKRPGREVNLSPQTSAEIMVKRFYEKTNIRYRRIKNGMRNNQGNVSVYVAKEFRVSRYMAPLIHNLDIRWW